MRLADEIARLESAGIDGLHLDVMDGHLVPELCLGPSIVSAVRKVTRLPLDVHLLVEDPERFIGAFVAAGADRITVHVESLGASAAVAHALEHIRERGCRAGVACFPTTPIAALGEHLAIADLVNPLGVDPRATGPGAGGPEHACERLRWLAREKYQRGATATLQADGGVWGKTRDGLVAAGAQELVAGYPIFSVVDRAAAVRALRTGV